MGTVYLRYRLEAIIGRQLLNTSVKFSGGVASKVLPATSMHSRLRFSQTSGNSVKNCR
jgi:hypothetical protein